MTKNTIEFGGSDKLALEYIRMRGYASYSSMVNVRDKRDPQPFKVTPYYTFGKELHSRFLEHKKLVTLSPEDEKLLKILINKLADDIMVQRIMYEAKTEQKFDLKLNGVRVLGYIDIDGNDLGDLKTTRHTGMKAFVPAMDFLQAALYKRVTGKRNFFYIGASKSPPYDIMVFNVNDYVPQLRIANAQLDYLLAYLKKNI